MPLLRLNWNERNFRLLEEFIPSIGRGDIAVFDWDNTCIFGDIGEAAFRHQVLGLNFRFGPKQLREIIPDQVNGISRIRNHGRVFSLTSVKERIVAAFEKICRRPPAGVRGSAPYRDFCAGLLALNQSFEQTPGIGCDFAYPWTVSFLQGFSVTQVRRLAGTTIVAELRSAITDCRLNDSDQNLLYRWTAGIRPFPEMTNLARAFKKAGCRVIVSTASNPLIVARMAQGMRFPADRVIGMEARSKGGILQGDLAPGLWPNFGSGKSENLKRLLDCEPLFVAGDSDGDYDMLTAFAATRLKLLIRRAAPGRMTRLYRQALAGQRRVLLQGVDRSRGRFSATADRHGLAGDSRE